MSVGDDKMEWRRWVITQGLLRDGQIWECRRYVFQIDSVRSGYRVAMFIEGKKSLQYVGVAQYSDEDSLLDLLDTMGMRPTSKILILRRR